MSINRHEDIPAAADFVAYETFPGKWAILRRVDGAWDCCANLDTLCFFIFVAGVAANHKAIWNHDARQFLTGSIDLLAGEY